uniref:Putative secreted peptide n=1 Tax=Anopheles braziliensis TaxID=58242 RepID=A0A2M3ZRJ4_9DIPT
MLDLSFCFFFVFSRFLIDSNVIGFMVTCPCISGVGHDDQRCFLVDHLGIAIDPQTRSTSATDRSTHRFGKTFCNCKLLFYHIEW